MPTRYYLFSTPSHGYLEVAKADAEAVGFVPTAYSYESTSLLFLEEDCDAGTFLDMVEEKSLQKPQIEVDYVDWFDPTSLGWNVRPCTTPEGASSYALRRGH